ncbi:gp106 [Mycobacterium phage Barnyard]|uniref:Uncharacterized protein n=1 Tax=Mycobacterium phage Barnyard TaxID=205880 RepID=Q855W6_9CAUD|nr:gp106 [Mycobacterium phage Barnyard]AAN02160.1 hypothetical protein PBI_BARNYARD_106 [Mycobacterium phage Barnyard]
MYAHCTYCPMDCTDDSADVVESWAMTHELAGGKHSVKIEGYEDHGD